MPGKICLTVLHGSTYCYRVEYSYFFLARSCNLQFWGQRNDLSEIISLNVTTARTDYINRQLKNKLFINMRHGCSVGYPTEIHTTQVYRYVLKN